MFYSHEVLTSRKHGVATVWLVATLGSKSITQKVNRKAIMNVDVPKACDTVVHPDAPLALRLQGNLLFGISRVYDQQCGYALTDVQNMREKMTTVYRQLKYSALDPDAGKTKRDQLVLQDDPSFIPSLVIPGLGEDLDILDIINDKPSAARHYLSSQLQSSISINSSALSEKGLKLDLSSSDATSALNGLVLASDMSSMQPNGHRVELSDLPPGLQEEKGILLDNDFEFDEDGNIVDLPTKRASYASSGRPFATEEKGKDDINEDAWLSTQFEDLQLDLELDHDAQDSSQERQNTDQDQESSTQAAQKPSVLDSEYVPVTEEISETTASAKEQQKHSPRKRHIRVLELDERPELRNSHLLEWNEEYLRNMARAKRLKLSHQMPSDARRNAALWVLEQGLGNVGSSIGGFEYNHMLKIYAGTSLLDSLHHARIASNDGQFANEIQEGDMKMHNVRDGEYDNGDMMRDEVDEIELGRNAPPSILDDYSSQMPWNITASVRAGSHPGSSIHSRRLHPSLGGFSSASNQVGFVGRMSRMTSASPLAGRSRFSHGPGNPEDDMDIDIDYPGLETSSANGVVGLDVGIPSSDAGQMASQRGQHDSFELCGPAAAVDTQTAGESQWVRGILEQESMNFLDFIRVRSEEVDGENGNGMISFSGLLPPETNTKVVATQALMHVLTLATRGALRVEQDESIYVTDTKCEMGEIYMQIAV